MSASPSSSSASNKHINIKVKYYKDKDAVYFKVKKTVALKKVFQAFCHTKRLTYEHLQFIHSGQLINGKATLEQLRMKDGDEIDAMGHQEGGGGCEPVIMG